MPEITDEQFWKMCDLHMSDPVALSQADLSRGFVYSRKWGVFYVPFGFHAHAMALLLSWDFGLNDTQDIVEHLKLWDVQAAAEYWLEHTPGSAYLSGVAKKIRLADFSTLTPEEKLVFTPNKCKLIGD